MESERARIVQHGSTFAVTPSRMQEPRQGIERANNLVWILEAFDPQAAPAFEPATVFFQRARVPRLEGAGRRGLQVRKVQKRVRVNLTRLEGETRRALLVDAVDSSPEGRVRRHVPELEDETPSERLFQPRQKRIGARRLEPPGGDEIGSIGAGASPQERYARTRARVADRNRHDSPQGGAFPEHGEEGPEAIGRFGEQARQPRVRKEDRDRGPPFEKGLERGRIVRPDAEV